ncbi:branched-chain amino acid ABC transporter permease [Treponema porcinum]|uniref:Amino acid/amide ABC transporter membrane protein 2, HAAT family (TC 3.A.1.4.-) n=2 Tax=Treponema TaxID=157 RepID=A0A1T4JHC3_TREPO|nr:branched-chain amino acid ABC transporter permease [Treponema porcinum]MDD7126694.1 branched-chain amino acid ABC transporter permease [Treponema porcinum]MDY5454294.1 branched-chain amino acid ABC transporter permease [Treponema porcinum]SJZ29572.1 amino acid/amide ABC transporter membrane protein 2, HAAT family (TC 3.A.1.4.-) [Treponema porcinum]
MILDKFSNSQRKFIMPVTTVIMILIITVLAKFEIINNYFQTIIVTICINIIMSASLNIVNGYMGEFSCGHGGFMATGAYVSSVVTLVLFKNGNAITGHALLPEGWALLGFPIAVIIGGLASMLVSLIVAIPSFKTRDDYLAIITVAANFIVTTAINNIPAVGASRGLMGMKSVMNGMAGVIDIPWILVWGLIFAITAVVAIHFLMNSTLGKGISAVKYDEISAEIMSVDTNRMKLIAFTFSSFLAGIAGGLFAHLLGFINPSSFGIMKSTESLVMVYLGGMGSLSGSVISAVVFTFLLELLRPAQILKWVIIPLILILIMEFHPEGIMGSRELTQVFPALKKLFPANKNLEKPEALSKEGGAA